MVPGFSIPLFPYVPKLLGNGVCNGVCNGAGRNPDRGNPSKRTHREFCVGFPNLDFMPELTPLHYIILRRRFTWQRIAKRKLWQWGALRGYNRP